MLILDETFSTSTAALGTTVRRAFAKNAMTSLTIAECAKDCIETVHKHE